MNRNNSGFTIVELIIVIAIIGIIATIIVVALNPAKNAANSRDTKREGDILLIMNKLQLYLSDNHKIIDIEAGSGVITECSSGFSNIGINNVNLNNILVDTYIQAIPNDPKSGCSSSDTCYDICKDTTNNKLTIKAPDAETKEISLTK